MKNAENTNTGRMVLQKEKVWPCFGSQFLLTQPIFWDISVSSRDLLTGTSNKQGKHSSIPLAKCHLFMQDFQNPSSFPPLKSDVHSQGRYLNVIIWDLSKAQHCCNGSWLPPDSRDIFIWTVTWLKLSTVPQCYTKVIISDITLMSNFIKRNKIKKLCRIPDRISP